MTFPHTRKKFFIWYGFFTFHNNQKCFFSGFHYLNSLCWLIVSVKVNIFSSNHVSVTALTNNWYFNFIQSNKLLKDSLFYNFCTCFTCEISFSDSIHDKMIIQKACKFTFSFSVIFICGWTLKPFLSGSCFDEEPQWRFQ
jgi:hypothetical protein